MRFLLLLSALVATTPAAANSPLPAYWDTPRKRGYYLDPKSITKIRLVKCFETQNPSQVRCDVEVDFVAVTFERPDPEQVIKVPREKIEDGQEKPKE